MKGFCSKCGKSLEGHVHVCFTEKGLLHYQCTFREKILFHYRRVELDCLTTPSERARQELIQHLENCGAIVPYKKNMSTEMLIIYPDSLYERMWVRGYKNSLALISSIQPLGLRDTVVEKIATQSFLLRRKPKYLFHDRQRRCIVKVAGKTITLLNKKIRRKEGGGEK